MRTTRHIKACGVASEVWTSHKSWYLSCEVAQRRSALLPREEDSHERKAWLFAGSELAGQRAAMVMSLVQSARMHGHDPWAYLKDVLTRLPSHLNSRIDELLPHRWTPQV